MPFFPIPISLTGLQIFELLFPASQFLSPFSLALYLLLTIIWGSGQVLVYSGIAEPTPAFRWEQIVTYGLVVLSLAFWAFARSFLQKEDWMPAGWLVGLAVLVLMAVLDWNWISLPFDIRAWTGGWFASEDVPFPLSAVAWACFSAQTALTTWYEYHHNESPLHRNRIKYLMASIVLVVAGYGFQLTQVESYQYLGLSTHWLGAVIAIYAVVNEHLPDISTHIRQALNYLIVTLFTIAVYLLSIYAVQAVLAPMLGPGILIGAAIAAVFLTVIYSPLQGMIQRAVGRVLFGQRYDSQKVVREYSQAISNVLYLDDLTVIAIGRISETLGVKRGALLLVEGEEKQIRLRMLPGIGVRNNDLCLSLTRQPEFTYTS